MVAKGISISSFLQILDRQRCRIRITLVALHQPLDIFGEHIDLDVDAVARFQIAKRCLAPRMRNDCNLQPPRVESGHRETDTIDGNRTLHRDISSQCLGSGETYSIGVTFRLYRNQLSGAIDVTLNHVPTQSFAHCERSLEIDARA